MAQRRDRGKRKMGRPVLLTPEVEEQLVKSVRAGVPVETSAELAGIARSTFMLWCQKGRDEEEHRAEGKPQNDDQQPFYDLWRRVVEARADAAQRNMLQIQKVAHGGAVTEETTRRYRDPETGEWVEETTVKRTPPDWRAAAWYLERQHARHFSKEAAQVQITGADGGPVQVSTVDPEDLAARITTNIAALVAGAPELIEAGDADYDVAEVIDDTPGVASVTAPHTV